MKIVTVNVPESYLDAIEKLVGDSGLYPSRSELIRCAVRKFLINELKMAKKMKEIQKEPKTDDLDDRKFVQVPVEKESKDNEPVREFKTYKIVRKLEF